MVYIEFEGTRMPVLGLEYFSSSQSETVIIKSHSIFVDLCTDKVCLLGDLL